MAIQKFVVSKDVSIYEAWSDRVTVAAHPDYNLCEVSILECENNTLVAFLRENSCMGYDTMKVISYDNGETCSDVYNTPMDCGHRPVSGFLQDGTVMVTYRFIPVGGVPENTYLGLYIL